MLSAAFDDLYAAKAAAAAFSNFVMQMAARSSADTARKLRTHDATVYLW